MTRTSSEVLISIEKEVKEIKNYLKQNEFLLKILLSKLNNQKKEEQIIEVKSENKDNSLIEEGFVQQDNKQESPLVKRLPGLKEGIFVSSNQVSNVKEEKEDILAELKKLNNQMSAKQSIQQTQQAVSKIKTNRKNQHVLVPVQQKVIYNDGKPVTMAHVELLVNKNGNLETFEKFQTNATGKWTRSVPPGEYVIKVFKNKNNQNHELRIEQVINIPESIEPVQLNDIKGNV